jgi:hypothetical protein
MVQPAFRAGWGLKRLGFAVSLQDYWGRYWGESGPEGQMKRRNLKDYAWLFITGAEGGIRWTMLKLFKLLQLLLHKLAVLCRYPQPIRNHLPPSAG